MKVRYTMLVVDQHLSNISKSRVIRNLDRTMKGIKSNHIMGEIVVLLAGDFKQTSPVITKTTPTDEININM